MSKPDGRRSDSVEVDEQRDWFEQLYVMAGDGEAEVPWNRGTPHKLFEDWARGVSGDGRRALVVGCGPGYDAEFAAELGFETVAFDFAATAIRQVRERFPESGVEYHVGPGGSPWRTWNRSRRTGSNWSCWRSSPNPIPVAGVPSWYAADYIGRGAGRYRTDELRPVSM